MNTLEKMFPSLTLFSDLNWEAVTQEYESHYIKLSFPEYLQQKALDGDCPPYLFELAFYELALFDARTSSENFPHEQGVYLNPTALFLSLEYDVKRMLEEASKGHVDVYEKDHVMAIFRDKHDKVHCEELDQEELSLLEQLEDGPANSTDEIKANQSILKKLLDNHLIINNE